MGILEFFGELFNPGPVGTIEGPPAGDDGDRRKTFVWTRFVIALLLIGAVEYALLSDQPLDRKGLVQGNLALLVYLLFAYFVRPRPNSDNLGWGPFLINNPFRVSDNINRFLVVLGVVLLPGRFVVQSIVDFFSHR